MNMQVILFAHFMAPQWLLYDLSTLFFIGFCFYCFRLLNPKIVYKFYGYWDWENEIVHGVCLFAMITALTPKLLPISSNVWAIILALCTIWISIRAVSWGRKLPYNKQWYDWAHVGMLGFMALMFYPIDQNMPVIVFRIIYLVELTFWIWFTGYNFFWLYLEIKKSKILSFGSTLAHLAAGIVMIAMTIWPTVFMPAHAHISNSGIKAINENNLQSEVLSANLPVAMLIHGGCEKCSSELPIFQSLAKEYEGRIKLVHVNKDMAYKLCKHLGVSKCPTVLIFKHGLVMNNRLDQISDKVQLRLFLDKEVVE